MEGMVKISSYESAFITSTFKLCQTLVVYEHCGVYGVAGIYSVYGYTALSGLSVPVINASLTPLKSRLDLRCNKILNGATL